MNTLVKDPQNKGIQNSQNKRKSECENKESYRAIE